MRKYNLPKVIGHRGAAGFAPENTLVSMSIAKECGAQMVEFDVKLTKDQNLIIMHDDTVNRTTNGHGNVQDFTLEELKELDAGSWFDSSFQGIKVPTLKEVFDVLKELNLKANIELKPCPGTDCKLAEVFVEFFQKNWPKTLSQPLISSFSLETLQKLRELNFSINLGLILDNPPPQEWQAWAMKLNCSAISFSHWSLKDGSLIKEIHAHNYPALAYTINHAKRAQTVYTMGADSIFTNYPGSIISL